MNNLDHHRNWRGISSGHYRGPHGIYSPRSPLPVWAIVGLVGLAGLVLAIGGWMS